MKEVSLIIELDTTDAFSAVASFEARSAEEASAALPSLRGVELDGSFGLCPIQDTTETDFGASFEIEGDEGSLQAEAFDYEPPITTHFIARTTVEENEAEKVAKKLVKEPSVRQVYADVEIQPQLICPGSPPLGNHGDVERLLCANALHRIDADGSGVLVAIVDTGINLAYLNAQGKNPGFDAARSWVPQSGLTPGSLPVGHGTMCAFDVCIAAPNCTLLDIALLQSTASGSGSPMSGLLSDAVRAYAHLVNVMRAPRRPGETRSLVVNNSWGMFHPSWDFPVGHPGNYSDNPDHPFNRIVATLSNHGADILFAAGNCGSDCPDGRCQGVTTRAIYGANSHRNVTCVAGVDTSKTRVGYSSKGPGRLVRAKPDISGYTHFSGSGVYAADGGTSAACPVVSGVFAAIRSKRPYVPGNASRTPDAIRNMVTSTAEDLGSSGYDFDHGFGVVNGCEIHRRLRPTIIDICRIRPDICRPRPIPIDICRRFPDLCRPRLPIPPIPPRPIPLPPGPLPPRPGTADEMSGGQAYGMLDLGANPEALAGLSLDELAELLYYMGYSDAISGESDMQTGRASPTGGGGSKCSCGG